MHILAAASRNALAQERVTIAAQKLADLYDLPAEIVTDLNIQEKDPMVKQILVTESVANLLEALLGQVTLPEGASVPLVPEVESPKEPETQEPEADSKLTQKQQRNKAK